MMNKTLLLFVVNDPTFFISHRLPLAEAARNNGFNVHVATMDGKAVEKIKKLGFIHHILPLKRKGLNPITEFFTFISIWRLFRHLRPDLVHLVTIKPVLYGGIAARIVKVSGVISAISGLGFLFSEKSSLRIRLLRHIALFFYRLSMGHDNQQVIFQNSSDMDALVTAGGVQKSKTRLIRGSGVDLKNFPIQHESKGVPIVIMASRLLKSKGIYEYVEAAKILKSTGTEVQFQLIGAPDPGNPESVTTKVLQSWEKEGVVECLGFRSDIPKLFSQAHIITLPSYYGEGLPKVLVEAAACGRAVVTTDMPGCRDAVEQGVTGLLVPPRNANALAQAIGLLIKDTNLRQQMGKESRLLAEREFRIEKIVAAHLDIYHDLEVTLLKT